VTLKNNVAIKSILGVTRPATLCTICTSLKSTDQGYILMLILWVYLSKQASKRLLKYCSYTASP